jgi:hypothetical protein
MSTTLTFAIMARAPVPGRCKTRLIPALGEEGAARLHEAMLRDTMGALDRVRADTFARMHRVLMAAPEDDGAARLRSLAPPGWRVCEQRGEGLGERLQHALADLCADDDARVVFFGADSPTLQTHVLEESLGALEEPRCALLGPCEDGGYYALGLSRGHRGLFEGIPWGTRDVANTTRARAEKLGVRLHEMAKGFDVDDPEGLTRLSEALRTLPASCARETRRVLRHMAAE